MLKLWLFIDLPQFIGDRTLDCLATAQLTEPRPDNVNYTASGGQSRLWLAVKVALSVKALGPVTDRLVPKVGEAKRASMEILLE